MRRFAAAMSLLVTALCIACSGGPSNTAATATRAALSSASPVPTVTFASTTLRIGTTTDARAIDVEAAITSEQSERGLGYRDALAADAGMLFDLHNTGVPTFWMKGMRFALDMVWIGEDERVVAVTADVPPQPGATDEQLRRYSPDAPVRYVLELNSGAAARLGIAPGAQLSFTLP
jgi:uncharacterized membrane protein (UPF0127 family)